MRRGRRSRSPQASHTALARRIGRHPGHAGSTPGSPVQRDEDPARSRRIRSIRDPSPDRACCWRFACGRGGTVPRRACACPAVHAKVVAIVGDHGRTSGAPDDLTVRATVRDRLSPRSTAARNANAAARPQDRLVEGYGTPMPYSRTSTARPRERTSSAMSASSSPAAH